jgi:hypothetical protein
MSADPRDKPGDDGVVGLRTAEAWLRFARDLFQPEEKSDFF